MGKKTFRQEQREEAMARLEELGRILILMRRSLKTSKMGKSLAAARSMRTRQSVTRKALSCLKKELCPGLPQAL